jgi:hypothetical protein
MLDFDNAKLPASVRPLPKRIDGHVLSVGDLKVIAQHFAGRPDPILGEELVVLLFPQMLDAPSGRHIPAEVLHHIGEGSVSAGRQVIKKLIANIREHGKPRAYAKGGAVRMSKADAGYEPCCDENRICVLCTMWRDKYRCSLVAGHIDRTGTCNHFERPEPKS